MIKSFNEQEDYRNAYLQSFEFFFQSFIHGEIDLYQQTMNVLNKDNKITLQQRNDSYYYENENYTMLIEPIYDKTDKLDAQDDIDFYDEEWEDRKILSTTTKCKITITKNNGEEESAIVCLPKIKQYSDVCTLNTFSNGYIEFKDKENDCNGWFDENGNKTTISDDYFIKDDKIFLLVKNTENYDINAKIENNFMIIDKNGNILLNTTALDIYDNRYLVKNSNNKMVLIDEQLNVISKEYDKIISTTQIDISPSFTSYYES